MKTTQTTARSWHPIEIGIIRRIARYGLMTPKALLASEAKGVQSLDEARFRLRALARRGDLVRHSQVADEDGFTLTSASVTQIKVQGVEHPVEVRSQPALMRSYARLSVCLLQEVRRTWLTTAEVTSLFADLNSSRHPCNYYLAHHGEQKRLGWLRIDGCGPGRWDRIARKAGDDMRKHLSVPFMRALIEAEQFEVCVVTALPIKARRIDEWLRTQQELLNVPYRVIAIPTLINFLGPRPG